MSVSLCYVLTDISSLPRHVNAPPTIPPLGSDHRVNLHTYRECCSGRRLVEWTLNQSSTYRPRQQVVQMWQALVSEGILKHGKFSLPPSTTSLSLPSPFPLHHLPFPLPTSQPSPPSPSTTSAPSLPLPPPLPQDPVNLSPLSFLSPNAVTSSHPFRDDDQLLYQFVDRPIVSDSRHGRRWSSLLGGLTDEKLPNGRPRSSSSVASSPRSSRSSLTSILDECFDTIAALGPEVLIYATLRKEWVPTH